MTPAARREALSRQWACLTKVLPIRDAPWCYNRPASLDDPVQGWKLHVSATILSAVEVFRRTLPVLQRHGALFKAPQTLDQLAALNAGLLGFAQIGKFLTVYPRDTARAVQLARELHQATRGLGGPRVPFDIPLAARSLVHYRFGAFRSNVPGGSDVIVDHRGRKHLDRRSPGQAVPHWVKNPFSPLKKSKKKRGLLGLRFLPLRALSQRGKGGVYEALDMFAKPPARCIVKEGRRHGETDWDNSDGASRLRREGRILDQLARFGVAAPRVVARFNQSGHAYLVLEQIPGRHWVPRDHGRRKFGSPARAARVLKDLTNLLAAIHKTGWVWRDCKPTNLIRSRGQVYALDFEGACRASAIDATVWSTPEFTPPGVRGPGTRPEGFREDIYALGVIVFQVATGQLPPPSPARRDRILQRHGVRSALRHRIHELLDGTVKSLAAHDSPR